jgi:plasmid stability protein
MQAEELKTRLPVGIKNWLFNRAAGNDRSMNAELVNILKNMMKAEAVSKTTIPEALGKLTDEGGRAA